MRGPAGMIVSGQAGARVGDEAISARDAEELAACFAVQARELFGYACVIVRGDRAQADDLVQASFEAAARAWWTLRCLTEDQRRGWLRKTVANIAVSGFRRDAAFRARLPGLSPGTARPKPTPRRRRSRRSRWSVAGRSLMPCR